MRTCLLFLASGHWSDWAAAAAIRTRRRTIRSGRPVLIRRRRQLKHVSTLMERTQINVAL